MMGQDSSRMGRAAWAQASNQPTHGRGKQPAGRHDRLAAADASQRMHPRFLRVQVQGYRNRPAPGQPGANSHLSGSSGSPRPLLFTTISQKRFCGVRRSMRPCRGNKAAAFVKKFAEINK